ncbi:hypothetical protein IFM89_027858 [Coptis chinensis]|uniref:Uncharacterized protein n=1 Tax=Coptis chinensis TaxID=261450 RepID=A0A835HFV1_9MAGN|nr:hypothetical protein IFM89_027858 [Coptis chinensis]
MGNREEQRNTMLDDGKKDRKWREKILEEDPGLWTVECLRGRLLAERVASKATKQNAELMENKVCFALFFFF